MLSCRYGSKRRRPSGGDSGKPGGLGKEYPRGLAGVEDCRPSSDRRRTAARLDCPGLRPNANEPEPLGSGGKRRRVESLEEQTETRAAFPINGSDCSRSRAPFRAIAAGVRPKPSPLGRPDSGRTPKAPVRGETESAASPEMDASAGISPKAGQLCVSPSPGGRDEAVSPRVKKNFKIWVLGKRLSSRMRPALPCILGWDGDGQREDILFASLPQVNIARGLIFRAGWRLFWDDMGLSVPPEGIEKAL